MRFANANHFDLSRRFAAPIESRSSVPLCLGGYFFTQLSAERHAATLG
jgi:hypothetical protein